MFDERKTIKDFTPFEPMNLVCTPLWVFDVDEHRIWWANRAALQFWRADSLEALRAVDFSSDSDTTRQRLQLVFNNILPGAVNVDTWTLYPNDEPVLVSLAMTPIRIENDRQAVFIECRSAEGATGDVHGLRLIEASRYTPLMVSTCASDGTVLSQNPAAAEAFGVVIEDAGAAIYGRFEDPDAARYIMGCAGCPGERSIDAEVRLRSGEVVWHRIVAKSGRDPVTGEPTVILTGTDITNEIAAERRLQSLNRDLERAVIERTEELERISEEATKARKEAERANTAKSNFLANMSHELRTPLNAILGFSEMIHQKRLGEEALGSYVEYAGDIHGSARHLLEMIENLLDLSKIEAGRMELVERELLLEPLIEETVALVSMAAERPKSAFSIDIAPEAAVLYADRRMLRQILTNLMNNAAKYAGDSAWIGVKAALVDGALQLSVADNGVGVKAADIPRLLSPYERSATQGIKRGRGTGLGLPIARALTELHGGELRMAGASGEGLSVEIILPRFRAVRRRPRRQATARLREAAS